VTVYVDDMYLYPLGRFRDMKMSHMIADTAEELHTLAAAIGMRREWYQGDHYDLNEPRRAAAIAAGAVPVTLRQCAVMAREQRRRGGPLPKPEEVDRIIDARATRLKARYPHYPRDE
jgi:hypothetical protein